MDIRWRRQGRTARPLPEVVRSASRFHLMTRDGQPMRSAIRGGPWAGLGGLLRGEEAGEEAPVVVRQVEGEHPQRERGPGARRIPGGHGTPPPGPPDRGS